MAERSGKISPLFDEQTFLRNTWISLAREDAPIEIFEQGAVQMSMKEKRILFNSISYHASWSGEIGDDRKETYTDYETYYETVPYTEYTRKYNSKTQRYEQVPYTVNKREARQRAVTRTRTVTDWHFSRGTTSGTHSDFACIDGSIDLAQFTNDYSASYVKYLSRAELLAEPDMMITDDMYRYVKPSHTDAIERAVMLSLPGDHSRGINYTIDRYVNTSSELIKVPEYFASISFKDSTYTKHAFPFGKMKMGGDGIKNKFGLRAKKAELRAKRDAAVKNQEKEIEAQSWKRIKPVSFLSLALLVFSICASLFIKVLPIVIIGFALALGGFIYSKAHIKSTQEKAKAQAQNFSAEKKKEMDDAYKAFAENYKTKLFAALNRKLADLGYETAKPTECYTYY